MKIDIDYNLAIFKFLGVHLDLQNNLTTSLRKVRQDSAKRKYRLNLIRNNAHHHALSIMCQLNTGTI
jgi:hypothetical protein